MDISLNFNRNLDADFLQFQKEQKQKLSRSFYLFFTLIVAIALLVCVGLYFFFPFFQTIVLIITAGMSLALLGFGYRLSRRGNLTASTWLLVIAMFLIVNTSSWVWGADIPLLIYNFHLIITAFIFISTRATIIVSFLSLFFVLNFYFNHNLFKTVTAAFKDNPLTDYLTFPAIGIAIPGFVFLVILLLRHQAVLAEFQNKRLNFAIAQLQSRQNTGNLMSQEILAIVSQLNSAATQQVTGSNQQVSTVTEIAQSIEELSHTASSISDITGQVNSAAEQIDRQSQEIEETTTLSVARSTDGINAVRETVAASSTVAQKYQLLMEALRMFSTKSQDMRRILDLLSNIASETHLLSLNAAIEAAGAGEYGVRFWVVAQETKNLAVRSGSASQEVVSIINQIEETLHSTIDIAQDGYDNSILMEMVSNQSHEILTEMNEVVKSARSQASSIREGIKGVLELAYTVKLATNQQQTASHQVLTSMQELSAVAEQFVHNSTTVSSSADNLENLSGELNLALTV
jgi:methyl-accepting chemotaxis protein